MIPDLRAHLRLIRLPNGLTTIADVIAGASVAATVTGTMASPGRIAIAALVTIALYSFGMALNDWVDRDKDRRLHPYRPLPSGQVKETAALGLVWAMPAAALLIAAALSPMTLFVAIALVAAISWYDTGARERTMTAAFAMGACRALSMGVGMTLGEQSPGLVMGLATASAYGFAVMAILIISLFEERTATRKQARRLVMYLGSMWCFSVLWGDWALIGLFLVIVLVWLIAEPTRRQPIVWGLVVRNAVFALPLLAGTIALSHTQWAAALVAAAVFPLVHLTARLIAQRGS